MNRIKTAAFALGATGIIAVNVVEMIRVHREESQKRKLIRENGHRQVNAIWYAGGRVQEKIAHGDYDGVKNPIEQMRTDAAFYETAFLEDGKDQS